jgi:outer membrane protein OmpA-like peptidoglycan-associated protein
MKRPLTIALVFLLGFAATAGALKYSPPGFTGGRGLYRVTSARTQGKGMLGTSLHGSWSLIPYGSDLSKFPMFQGDTTGARDDAHHYGNIHFALSYSALEYLEPSFALNFTGQADNRPTGPHRWDDPVGPTNTALIGNEGLIKIQDFEFAIKAVYPSKEYGAYKMSYAVGLQPFLAVGLSRESSIFYNYKSGLNKREADSSMVAHGFPSFAGHAPDFGAKFLMDFAVKPLQLHVNLGYRKSGEYKDSTFAVYSDTFYARRHIWASRPALPKRTDRFLWGTGIEVAAGPWITLILEGSGDNPIGAEAADSTGRNRIGGGLRFNTPAGVSVDMGGEGLAGKTRPGDPSWTAFFGLSVSASLLPPPKPKPQGTIAGRVRDSETDKPLYTADVKISELPTVKISLDSLGGFRAIVPPGLFHVSAAAGDSFISQDKTVTLQDQGSAYLDFTMRRKEFPKGTLVGKITDFKSGDPVMGSVSLGDTGKVKPIIADGTNGIYKGEAPPGVYNATCSAPDYLPVTLPVTIKNKETTLQNFQLKAKLKVGEKFVIKGVFFDRRGGLMPESRVALEEVAQRLKDNPTVIVEIGGHTDSRGSSRRKLRISQTRADNVRLNIINTYNMSGERITSKGYGGMFPIDTNKTKVGRANNNRIELKVLSRTDLNK